ncbi:MAG: monovalent cation/H+ antiporter complex subunit F [Chloroflexota bacterium]|nr:monovalent cation/H+ antiporter complex subunit F [Chloroflexota bacterium]
MSEFLNLAAQVALIVMIVLLVPTTYRVWVGPTPADRLQAVDTITTLLIGIIVLLGIVQGSALIIDVGIALAAFSFVGAIAIARYLCEGKVF